MKVEVGPDVCCGYGDCVVQADDVFELDEETALASASRTEVPPERQQAVRAAAAGRPICAIRVLGPR